jgi:ferric-dicitrate binding protein FerR (iron transport regulator)
VSNNTGLDDELAELTDALMSGQPYHASDEARELAAVVEQIHTLIAPHDQPDAAFRNRVTQRVMEEWDNLQASPRRTRWRMRRTQLRPLTALAAALALAVLAVALITIQGDDSGEPVQGTALGELPVVSIAVIGGIVTVVLGSIVFWLWLRRRS